MTYNRTYIKYNLGPFAKVMLGKNVGYVVPSEELPNDKVVVSMDREHKDDIVTETKVVSAYKLSVIQSANDSSHLVSKKKFLSEEESERHPGRDGRKAPRHGTEVRGRAQRSS